MYTNAAGTLGVFSAICLSGTSINHRHPKPCFITNKSIPGASYICAYESGKFGYWIQRKFETLVIKCLVVNSADIASTHKDKFYSTDTRDAREICQALADGRLRGIYVPFLKQEVERNIVRHRKKSGAILFAARTG